MTTLRLIGACVDRRGGADVPAGRWRDRGGGLEHRNLERFRKQTATWTAAVAEGWRRKLDEFAAFADLPDQEE